MHARSQSHSGYTPAYSHSHPITTTTASSPPSLFGIISDDVSDDKYGFASASGSGGPVTGKSGSEQGTVRGVMGKPTGTNNFVTKLYQMINDPKSRHYIAWTEHGTSFVVCNVGEFSRSILGPHFKHNNFSSFVRQLNMYGFHKINRTPRAQRTSTSSQTWEFSHPKFLRERPDLLDTIKRKALEADPWETRRIELPGEVARFLGNIREENRALWREIRQLGGQIPPQFANSLGSFSLSQSLSVSAQGHTSSNLSDEVPPLSLAGSLPSSPQPPSLEWCRWVEAEIGKWRSREDKLVHDVRTPVDAVNSGAKTRSGKGTRTGSGLGISTGTNKSGEGEDVHAAILQDFHALSLVGSSHSPSGGDGNAGAGNAWVRGASTNGQNISCWSRVHSGSADNRAAGPCDPPKYACV